MAGEVLALAFSSLDVKALGICVDQKLSAFELIDSS